MLIIEQNPHGSLLHKSVGIKQSPHFSPCPAWLDPMERMNLEQGNALLAHSGMASMAQLMAAGNAQLQGSHDVLSSVSLSHRHDSLTKHAKIGSICSWDSLIQVSLHFWNFYRDCRGTIHLLALQNELCWTFMLSLHFLFQTCFN